MIIPIHASGVDTESKPIVVMPFHTPPKRSANIFFSPKPIMNSEAPADIPSNVTVLESRYGLKSFYVCIGPIDICGNIVRYAP